MITDEDSLCGRPEEEIEEPIESNQSLDISLNTDYLEDKEKDRKEKRYFSAFKLIIGCLVFLGIIFVIDTIAFGKTSETTNSIIEFIKTLLFTLSGYLFLRNKMVTKYYK